MSIVDNKLVPAQIDYRPKDLSAPKYKFSRIVPLSGSQQVTVPLASTAEVLFEIPTSVFNFSESYLSAVGPVGTAFASGTATSVGVYYAPDGATLFTWVYTDGMPLISEVDLYTRSGTYLCQLPNFQNYMKIVRKVNTKESEFETADQNGFLYPSNSLGNAPPAITPNNGASLVNYRGPAYATNNNVLHGTALNSAAGLNMNLPLKAIKKTIFELNKDVVFPDILVLRILFGPANKAKFGSTSAADPTVGAATAVGTITINNLTLYLATEKNEDIAQSVRALVNQPSGMNLLIPFPYTYKQSLPAAGAASNISLRFNRGHGKNLLEIYTSAFHATEASNSAYDCANMNLTGGLPAPNSDPLKINNFYSMLDNIRLQDITIQCANATQDDWRENRKFIKDSPIKTLEGYWNNWFHLDRFYEKNPTDIVPEDNIDAGMSLIVERKYDFLSNTMAGAGATLQWYVHAIVQRVLHVDSRMIMYM